MSKSWNMKAVSFRPSQASTKMRFLSIFLPPCNFPFLLGCERRRYSVVKVNVEDSNYDLPRIRLVPGAAHFCLSHLSTVTAAERSFPVINVSSGNKSFPLSLESRNCWKEVRGRNNFHRKPLFRTEISNGRCLYDWIFPESRRGSTRATDILGRLTGLACPFLSMFFLVTACGIGHSHSRMQINLLGASYASHAALPNGRTERIRGIH